jgi:hypothetical protein
MEEYDRMRNGEESKESRASEQQIAGLGQSLRHSAARVLKRRAWSELHIEAGLQIAHQSYESKPSWGRRRGIKTRKQREIMLRITTMSRSRGYIYKREEELEKRWRV